MRHFKEEEKTKKTYYICSFYLINKLIGAFPLFSQSNKLKEKKYNSKEQPTNLDSLVKQII